MIRTYTIITTLLVAIIVMSPLIVTQSKVLAQRQGVALGSILKLSRANVPIDIQLIEGFENGHIIFFIGTNISDQKAAEQLTKMNNFQ